MAEAGLSCLLVGQRGGGGEEVYLRDLLEWPPEGVDYRTVWEPHESAPDARARAWQERLFNRLVQPRLWPLSGLRSYCVGPSIDLVHVHNATHRVDPARPVVMSLGGAGYRHYLERYLRYEPDRVEALYDTARALYPRLGVANEYAHWDPIDALVVFSRYAADELVATGVPAERVHVVPPLVPSPSAPGPSPGVRGEGDRLRVVFAGRDPARKGADVALEAVGLLRARGLPVELTLVGDPSFSRLTRTGVRGFGPEPGSVIRAERLPAADVVVVPSREEGYGLLAREALAAGRPVLVSDTAALPEIVGTPEWVCPVGDVGAWADTLASFLDVEFLKAAARRAVERHAAEFAPDRCRRRLRAVYDQVLSVRQEQGRGLRPVP